MNIERLKLMLEDGDTLSVGQILDRFGIQDNSISRRRLRAFLDEAIQLHQVPIGMTTEGIFLCHDERTIQKALRYLETVENSYRKRRNALENAFENREEMRQPTKV